METSTSQPPQRIADFRQYHVGCLNALGDRITAIVARNNRRIVYLCEGRETVTIEAEPNFDLSALSTEQAIIQAEITTTLQGTYKAVWHIYGSCVAAAMDSADSKDVAKYFQPVREFCAAHGPISTVYGTNDEYAVFIGKDGELVFELNGSTEPRIATIAEMRRIQASSATMPRAVKDQLKEMLGRALSTAFAQTDVKKAEQCFSVAQDFLNKTSHGLTRTRLALYSITAAVVMLVILAIAFSEISLRFPQYMYTVVGATGGTLGALVSLLHRLDRLELPAFLPRRYLGAQVLVRLSIGACFGLIAVVVSKANFALGMFSSQNSLLFLLGVAAGFSERFIPDMLDQMAVKNSHVKAS